MKLSLFTLGLASVCGMLPLLYLSQLPSTQTLMLTSGYALITIIASLYSKSRCSRILLLAAVSTLAFDYACTRAQEALDHRLPAATEGYYRLIGTIDSLPIRNPDYNQAEISVRQLVPIGHPGPTLLPRSLHLSWYQSFAPWQVGETWALNVKLKAPRSTYNPASFDQEAWYLVHGIDAIGYVSATNTAQLLDRGPWWRHLTDRIRGQLSDAIWASCQQQAGCTQVQALTLGQRDHFSHSDWQLLQATGTNHLFAIAGLHIGLVAAACFWLGKNLWRRLTPLLLWVAAPTAGWWLALIGALSYSALAGFALPTQRACATLSILVIARLLNRQIPPWHAWLCALLIILLVQPLWLLDSSLWLSFSTVALLIYGFAYRWPKKTSKWHELFYLQWLLSMGLWPLTVLYFHSISLSNFFANAGAIPWVAITVLPLCLIGALCYGIFPSLAALLWQVAGFNLSLLKIALAWLSHLPYSQYPLSFHTPWLAVLGTIGVVLLLAPQALPARWLGLCYCYAALFWPKPIPDSGAVWLSLLDVGQGLSAMVRTQHHALVFDTGSRFSDQADMGQSVVIPALSAAGVRHLDTLVISHADNDHAGGAASVWAHLPIDTFYTSDLPRLKRMVPQANWQACYAGQAWHWDGVDFQFLYPDHDNHQKTTNNRCCVLKITTQSQQILLTADIEQPSESSLLEHQPEALASSILVVPHHGSKTSSSEAFVTAVHARYVLLPYGYHNRYHFPHPSVMARYHRQQAQLYDSVTDGQIDLVLNGSNSGISIDPTRLTHKRFWRLP